MNQHSSNKRNLLEMLYAARACLKLGWISNAQANLSVYRRAYARVPASTRRRWKCGY